MQSNAKMTEVPDFARKLAVAGNALASTAAAATTGDAAGVIAGLASSVIALFDLAPDRSATGGAAISEEGNYVGDCVMM